jgi:hypothetical protein
VAGIPGVTPTEEMNQMANTHRKLLAVLWVIAAGALLGLGGFFAWALRLAARDGRWIGF